MSNNISVLVRLHRRPKQIAIALDSIFSQKYPKDSIEFVFSTDFEGDRELDVALDMTSRENLGSNVKVVRFKESLGYPFPGINYCDAYFNTMMREASGRWLFFMDDDEKLIDDLFFKKINEVFEAGNEIMISRWRVSPYQILPGYWREHPRQGHISTQCFCAPRDIALKAEWGKSGHGDYIYISQLYSMTDSTKIYWNDAIVGETQNGTHSWGKIEC